MSQTILVAGAGWLGSAIARSLLASGHRVIAIRRALAPLASLEAAGATPLVLDLEAPGAADRIPPGIDAIVACQSSSSDTVEGYRAAYVAANRALLDAAGRLGVGAFVYTGSTGVFGQRDGSDVSEATPPAPSGPTGEVLVEAEEAVLAAARFGIPARIVRLSGLYGPGRTGIVERVRSARLALGPGDDAWMNFCHLEDAVAFVRAALERGEAGGVYHGSDAAPARRREVVEWIAERLGTPAATVGAPAQGPNRRIRSEWTRAALGVELRFPSFREGLAAALPRPGLRPR